MFLLVLSVALSLLFSFVCSISEATLLSVGRARVETLAQGGSTLGLLLRRFRLEPDRPIAAILIVNTIANSGGAAISSLILSSAPATKVARSSRLFALNDAIVAPSSFLVVRKTAVSSP